MVDGGDCRGYRCVDLDECHVYDELTKKTTLAHDSSTCGSVEADEQSTFQYKDKSGQLLLISTDEAQELMGCTFTSKLLFQRTSLLRNYAFWGFADCEVDGFHHITAQSIKSNEISPKVAIGHVASLVEVEDNPLGLFAIDDIADLTFLGEYTGVLQVHNEGVNRFDPYGVSYPSVYESGDLYVSASEYGNVIRCINHSYSPNARFVPMIQGGILHIFCFAIKNIKAGEQIFVNYGTAYWKSTGFEPIAV
uniref:SET domain-containing protein n=1 Tax=Globisporangium ultimum (strain ATCC 200006 / CBS 805.95 / DAOM BR144) TaxID=431595 RepID=K3WLZ9_GLOUD